MKDPITIVTGASSGIGKAVYDCLRNHKLFGKVKGLSRRGPDIKLDLGHFASEESWHVRERIISDAINPYTLDGDTRVANLINCAGIMRLDESEYWTQQEIMKVNFWSIVHLCEAMLPRMNPGSTITNISSISAIRPETDLPVYSASKAALNAYSTALALRLAPRGIRVNTISPGFFDTNLVEDDPPQELINQIPMRRQAQPFEIVEAVRMILGSSYMTGANIVLDGGLQWNK